mmetsp:Transcript_17051/g.32101  ORF Transcript_17051/g.32101 Transcript_17051/m.32101 type:complete len:359 (-) Transcript_17051:137-1213(-)
MKRFGIKVLLYHATKELNLHYDLDFVTTLTFPAEMIWKTYSDKKTMYSNRDQWVQYKDELVIQNHGTGLKLFPLLEVLEHNHHVIFFDLDMGFLFDPIPYLWQGSAETPDVICSLEAIKCASQPNNPVADIQINGRAEYMPNSGTLMVRSSEAGKSFLREWMNATVEGNWYNEQYTFRWPKGYRMAPSESCNKLPNGLISGSLNPYSTTLRDNDSKSIRYCFLNKFLFQTGMILFGCRYQSYYGNTSQAGIPHKVLDSKSNKMKEYYFPVNVHVNARTPKSFKTKKNTLLKDLRVWVYDPSGRSPPHTHTIATPTADIKPLPSSSLQCKDLDLSASRWVTKRFNPPWHSTWYFPDDLT